jgi:hypothetical protein
MPCVNLADNCGGSHLVGPGAKWVNGGVTSLPHFEQRAMVVAECSFSILIVYNVFGCGLQIT